MDEAAGAIAADASSSPTDGPEAAERLRLKLEAADALHATRLANLFDAEIRVDPDAQSADELEVRVAADAQVAKELAALFEVQVRDETAAQREADAQSALELEALQLAEALRQEEADARRARELAALEEAEAQRLQLLEEADAQSARQMAEQGAADALRTRQQEEADAAYARRLVQDERAILQREAADVKQSVFGEGSTAQQPRRQLPTLADPSSLSYSQAAATGVQPATQYQPAVGRNLAARAPVPPLRACKLQLVIDGSNVAFNYGANRRFEPRGIYLCVMFWQRKHGMPKKAIAVTLSSSRYDESNRELAWLEQEGYLSYTPVNKDDDLFAIQSAEQSGAWIVTNDQYHQHARWMSSVKHRLIQYTFVQDEFVPDVHAVDRLGRRRGNE